MAEEQGCLNGHARIWGGAEVGNPPGQGFEVSNRLLSVATPGRDMPRRRTRVLDDSFERSRAGPVTAGPAPGNKPWTPALDALFEEVAERQYTAPAVPRS